jgi:HPt (histidine-containing phosphotransfer) domain-containing protein
MGRLLGVASCGVKMDNHKYVAHPAAPDALLLFDEADILRRMDNDRDFVRMILDESRVELPRQLEGLRELCRGSETKAIRSLAHTMKGLAANISTGALRAIAARMEAAAKEDDLVTVRELLPELERMVFLTIEAIR